MSSRQQQRVASAAEGEQIERAEAHAREAAREIAHERTERARVVAAGAPDGKTEAQRRQPEERHGAGILETVQQGARSLLSAVGRTLGVARDTTADKLAEHKDYAADKASQAGDATAQKAGEYKDYAADRATAAKDYAADKATGMKDAAAHKASETAQVAKDKAVVVKDATAQKASETAEMATKRLGEYKDSAAQAAKETKDAAAEKARETKEAGAVKAAEAKDAAKQKTEELSKTAREDDRTMEDTTRPSSPEEKLEEYKQSATDAARTAMEYLTLRTEEAKEQSKASGDATEELSRQELEATREQVAEGERRWKDRAGASCSCSGRRTRGV